MADLTRILVVAATRRELGTPHGWRALECGVGPVEAAVATATAIQEHRPAAILHVGIAGARRASGIALGALVIGRESRYCDLHIPPHFAPNRVAASPALLAAAARVIPDALHLTIGTTARVGAGDTEVEAMEGFAVLRAAERAGIPAIEVRAISNEVEETDRAKWRFDDAFRAITEVTPRLVEEIAQCVG